MSSVPSFAELGLRPEILRAVAESGYTTPTPIQQQAIPVVLAGLDVMGGAQTGTGKTAGFGLPILHKLSQHANASPSPARHPVRALILVDADSVSYMKRDKPKPLVLFEVAKAMVTGGTPELGTVKKLQMNET